MPPCIIVILFVLESHVVYCVNLRKEIKLKKLNEDKLQSSSSKKKSVTTTGDPWRCFDLCGELVFDVCCEVP